VTIPTTAEIQVTIQGIPTKRQHSPTPSIILRMTTSTDVPFLKFGANVEEKWFKSSRQIATKLSGQPFIPEPLKQQPIRTSDITSAEPGLSTSPGVEKVSSSTTQSQSTLRIEEHLSMSSNANC